MTTVCWSEFTSFELMSMQGVELDEVDEDIDYDCYEVREDFDVCPMCASIGCDYCLM